MQALTPSPFRLICVLDNCNDLLIISSKDVHVHVKPKMFLLVVSVNVVMLIRMIVKDTQAK